MIDTNSPFPKSNSNVEREVAMKHLIVIADPANGKNHAFKRALEIQRHTDAAITLLGFCFATLGTAGELKATGLNRKQLEQAVRDKRSEELNALVQTCKAQRVKVVTVWGEDISNGAIAYCRKHPANLLIKSGHRSENLLYTPSDWRLLRESPIPVMIIASKSWKKKSRIVAAVDFATKKKSKQQLNDKIVNQAKALAASLKDEVHLAFAIAIPQVLADMDLINPRKYADNKRKKLLPGIEQFCDKHEIALERVHLKQGPVEKIIPSIANSLKADVVVAGTVARKGVKGKLMGNTAEALLSNLYTDILAVKP